MTENKKKIKEEDLNTVSGGWVENLESEEQDLIGGHGVIVTNMVCSNCGFMTRWRGRFIDGKKYYCPNCGKRTLHGEYDH